MNKEINTLLNNFEYIKKMDFIKAINNYSNGGGLTLEYLFGIKANNRCYPDLNGIELKTINQYWEKDINLFSDTPISNQKSTVKWITEKYGYISKIYKNKKIFNGKISTNTLVKIGLNYFFKIRIDKKDKKIYMEIYDNKKNLINCSIYWSFENLKKKLEKKLSFLALIYLEKKYIKNIQYCKYTKIKIFKLKDFKTFIYLIEQGIIKISFSTSYIKKGKKEGSFHDHGTKFFINEKNIYLLFNEIKKD